jgi:hypothetical protein
MIHRYVAATRISAVEERFEKRHVSGVGPDAVMDEVSTGWWIVTAAPQPYATCVGSVRPPHEVGQEVRMAVEVVT